MSGDSNYLIYTMKSNEGSMVPRSLTRLANGWVKSMIPSKSEIFLTSIATTLPPLATLLHNEPSSA